MRIVVAILLISAYNFSCSAVRLQHEVHKNLPPSTNDEKIRVISRVLNQSGGTPDGCSNPVSSQPFFVILELGNHIKQRISDDVMTDSQGYLTSLFSLTGRHGIPAKGSIKLCPGPRDSYSNNHQSGCAAVEFKRSDIRSSETERLDDGKDREGILSVRWCLSSNSGEIINGGEENIIGGAEHTRNRGSHYRRLGLNQQKNPSDRMPRNNHFLARFPQKNIDKPQIRRKRSSDVGFLSQPRKPFAFSRGRADKQILENPDEMWINENADDKRMWGDSGEAWLKRNEDKRMWGDSGEAWLKRNLDKRMWGDSGEAWLKRNYNNRVWLGLAPTAMQSKVGDKLQSLRSEIENKENEKRVWGDDGMAWVK